MTNPFSYGCNEVDATPTAAKVAEVFLTAGHAFQKLGDLALKLNQPITENTNETKWSEKDVDRLKDALSRFANDLDEISDSVQNRIVQRIKTDIKRKTMVGGVLADTRTPLNTSVSSFAASRMPGGSIVTSSSLHNGVSTTTTTAPLDTAGGTLGVAQHDDYVAAPPMLNAQSLQPSQSSLSTGTGLNALKRTASPSSGIYGTTAGAAATMVHRVGGGASYESGGPLYKKPAYGSAGTLRQIRTINTGVNSAQIVQHNVQVARPVHPQQQHHIQHVHQIRSQQPPQYHPYQPTQQQPHQPGQRHVFRTQSAATATGTSSLSSGTAANDLAPPNSPPRDASLDADSATPMSQQL